MTPEQMRALADGVINTSEKPSPVMPTLFDMRAALRAAADQLEAVHRWNWRHEGVFADDELEAILTADTAGRENRHE